MQIKLGQYRHYKGGLYEVIGCARHSETEEWLVVYKTCYGDYSTWVRPYEMFMGNVMVDGQETPRFVYQKKSHRLSTQSNESLMKNDSDDILKALNSSVR